MDYAMKIKEYRLKKFLSQTDLAILLHVSTVTVNRWETGKYEPTLKIKKKLHDLFLEVGIEEN